MTASKVIRRFGRPVRDFSLSLGAFGAVTLLSVCEGAQKTGLVGGQAHAFRFMGEGSSGAGFVTAATETSMQLQNGAAMLSLAIAFAGMFTLNLWFARHVRRVRAVERRRIGR